MVECGGLENRWVRKGLRGSNPLSSDYCSRIDSGWRNDDRNVSKIAWNDYSEAIPAFLAVIGIPLSLMAWH